MDSVEDSIKEINDVFSFFQDPMEKIEQLIDYGKMASEKQYAAFDPFSFE